MTRDAVWAQQVRGCQYPWNFSISRSIGDPWTLGSSIVEFRRVLPQLCSHHSSANCSVSTTLFQLTGGAITIELESENKTGASTSVYLVTVSNALSTSPYIRKVKLLASKFPTALSLDICTTEWTKMETQSSLDRAFLRGLPKSQCTVYPFATPSSWLTNEDVSCGREPSGYGPRSSPYSPIPPLSIELFQNDRPVTSLRYTEQSLLHRTYILVLSNSPITVLPTRAIIDYPTARTSPK